MNCSDTEVPVVEIKKTQKLRPIGDRVQVKLIKQEDEMVNGLYTPDIAKEKPQQGIVVAVGKGRLFNGERIPVDVAVGERILFGKYCGNDIEVNGELYLLLQENEIQGAFEAD